MAVPVDPAVSWLAVDGGGWDEAVSVMLSERRRKFCEQFLQTGDEELAAKMAGYRNQGQGRRLLSDAALWLEWSREQYSCLVADRQEILEFYTVMMRGEVDGTTELKLSERLKCAEALSRMLGLFSSGDEELTAVRIVDDCDADGVDDDADE